jgi:hypothetical protein
MVVCVRTKIARMCDCYHKQPVTPPGCSFHPELGGGMGKHAAGEFSRMRAS